MTNKELRDMKRDQDETKLWQNDICSSAIFV